MTKPKWILASLVLGLVAAAWGARGLMAQTTGFNRAVLQKQDLSTAGREAVVARGEFAPGGVVAKHTHPGEELAYVLEGQLVIEMEGKPPQTLKAGEVFFVPAGVVHTAKNGGKTPAKVLSTYFVEKGKPLATPVAMK
jgi:quercetin dioxygenase-like cupin family protein